MSLAKYHTTDIPEYPAKVPLSLSHKPFVDELNRAANNKASAANFTNLFILDTDNDTFITRVKDTVLIEQLDFTGSSQYIVLPHPREHASFDPTLPERLKKKAINRIVLFPFAYADLTPDADNSDYIYDAPETASLRGKRYKDFRRKVNAFARRAPEFRKIPSSDYGELWKLALELHNRAVTNNPSKTESLRIELQALEKALNFTNELSVNIDGLYVQNAMVGYSVTEVVRQENSHLLVHIFRTDNKHSGISEYLFHRLAVTYQNECDLINFEQDLGVAGLRRFKNSLQPVYQIPAYSYESSHQPIAAE